MNEQRIFFFDLDGTLEDSRRDMTDAVHAVRAELGLPARVDEEVTGNVNRGMTELYEACLEDWLASQLASGKTRETALTEIAAMYAQAYAARIADHTRLYAGMRETLAVLAAVGKIVVVTNKPEALSRLLLEALGIGPWVTDVMGGDTCAACKPSPLPLHVAAERLGFVPGRDKAWMIGDSVADVRCGRAFGATTIWCAWGYLPNPPLPAPDHVAHTPLDLLALVGL
jgi:phosphoglycolate phosphatase